MITLLTSKENRTRIDNVNISNLRNENSYYCRKLKHLKDSFNYFGDGNNKKSYNHNGNDFIRN